MAGTAVSSDANGAVDSERPAGLIDRNPRSWAFRVCGPRRAPGFRAGGRGGADSSVSRESGRGRPRSPMSSSPPVRKTTRCVVNPARMPFMAATRGCPWTARRRTRRSWCSPRAPRCRARSASGATARAAGGAGSSSTSSRRNAHGAGGKNPLRARAHSYRAHGPTRCSTEAAHGHSARSARRARARDRPSRPRDRVVFVGRRVSAARGRQSASRAQRGCGR
jgi:hypothetical protein